MRENQLIQGRVGPALQIVILLICLRFGHWQKSTILSSD